MKKFLLFIIVLVGFASVAFAGAIPSSTIDAPGITWTGFYIGANIDWAGMHYDNSYYTPGGAAAPYWLPGDAAAISAGGVNAFNPARIAGGVQAGYNYQKGKIVTGLEADFNLLRLSGQSSAVANGTSPGIVANYNTNAKMDWMITVRPRIGLTFGRYLPYITGGLALVHNSFTQSVLFPGGASSAVSDGGVSYTSTQAAWTLGGGMEYGYSPNWSIKAEYLHVFMPNKTLTSYGHSPYAGNTVPIPYTRTISRSINTVHVGVNYRFK
jgi:outer membrane immunogenic protein